MNIKKSDNNIHNNLVLSSISVEKDAPWKFQSAQYQSLEFNPILDPTVIFTIEGTTWKLLCSNISAIKTTDIQIIHVLLNSIIKNFKNITILLNFQDLPISTLPLITVICLDEYDLRGS